MRAEALYLPLELEGLLGQMNIKSTDVLVSVLESFPSALAAHLGWNAAESIRAAAEALAKLREAGIATRACALPTSRGTGALPPGWLK